MEDQLFESACLTPEDSAPLAHELAKIVPQLRAIRRREALADT